MLIDDRDRFDFSDHIVLYYVQVYPICVITLYAVTSKIAFGRLLQSITPGYMYPGEEGVVAFVGRVVKVLGVYYVYVGVPGLMIWECCRGSYKTAKFFHTPRETVVGMGICYAFWFLALKFRK